MPTQLSSSPSRTRRLLVAGVLLLLVAVAMAVGRLVDPMNPAAGGSLLPHCPLKWLTGYDCPGCGTTRALHALMHGDPAGAFAANPFMAASLPVIVAAACCEVAPPWRLERLRRVLLSRTFIALYLVAALLWWVGRNVFIHH